MVVVWVVSLSAMETSPTAWLPENIYLLFRVYLEFGTAVAGNDGALPQYTIPGSLKLFPGVQAISGIWLVFHLFSQLGKRFQPH